MARGEARGVPDGPRRDPRGCAAGRLSRADRRVSGTWSEGYRVRVLRVQRLFRGIAQWWRLSVTERMAK
jgi:hypothetical protein